MLHQLLQNTPDAMLCSGAVFHTELVITIKWQTCVHQPAQNWHNLYEGKRQAIVVSEENPDVYFAMVIGTYKQNIYI